MKGEAKKEWKTQREIVENEISSESFALRVIYWSRSEKFLNVSYSHSNNLKSVKNGIKLPKMD